MLEDIESRDPTPRMFESAHTDIADGLAYTIDAVLLLLNRTAVNKPAGLSIVYPLVREASRIPLPLEDALREILAALPVEDVLRDIMFTRDTSVHRYTQVRYTMPDEVRSAYRDVLAFWTSATALTIPIIGPLEMDGAITELPPKR